MAIVKLISGQIIEGAQLKNIKHEGDEGSRSAIALINGKEISVYNSIVDGFNRIWVEQMSIEEYRQRKANGTLPPME